MKIEVLSGDAERAQTEVDCFNYCRINGERAFMQGDFKEAACYYENATRALRALDSMQDAKQKLEQASLIFKQIKGEKEMLDLINNLQLGFVPRIENRP